MTNRKRKKAITISTKWDVKLIKELFDTEYDGCWHYWEDCPEVWYCRTDNFTFRLSLKLDDVFYVSTTEISVIRRHKSRSYYVVNDDDLTVVAGPVYSKKAALRLYASILRLEGGNQNTDG